MKKFFLNYPKLSIVMFVFIFLFCFGCQTSRKNLSDISSISDNTESQVTIESLEGQTTRTHIQNIDDNFDELYALTDTTDPSFVGMSGSVITSGTIADDRIASTIARDTEITYESLNSNSDVGTGSGQVAAGDHTHTGVYEPADATILKDADIGSTVESATSNDFDPDRLAGDTTDDNLISGSIIDTSTLTGVDAETLTPAKTSGVAGYSYWYEADTTNTLKRGFQGPDDLSVNISDKLPNDAGSVGQIPVISNVQTSQTLPNGETGTIVTYTNTTVIPTDDGYGAGWDGDKTEIPSKDDIYDQIESLSLSSGAPTFQTSDPTAEDTSGLYINTTDGDMFAVNQNVGVSTWTTTYTPWWLLTVSDPGNNNYITSDGTINCGNGNSDCTQYLVNSSTPTLTSNVASGYEFLAWTGDATDTSTTTNPDTITMSSAKSVGASFNLLPTVTAVTINGANITMTFSEAATQGTGWFDTLFNLDGGTMGDNIDIDYVSGDGTTSWTFTSDTAATTGEAINLDYTGTLTDAIEDSNGGDVSEITDFSVANNTAGGYSEWDTFWEVETTALETGGTATLNGTAAIAASGCYENNCVNVPNRFSADNSVQFSHTLGTSPTSFEIHFYMAVSSYGTPRILRLPGVTGYDYVSISSTDGDTIEFRVAGTAPTFDPTETWADGSMHSFVFTANTSTSSWSMSIDEGTAYTSSASFSGTLNLSGTCVLGYNSGLEANFDKIGLK